VIIVSGISDRDHRLDGLRAGADDYLVKLMGPMSKAFVADIHRFAKSEGIEIVHFQRGQRKDEETQRRLKDFPGKEDVLAHGANPVM